MSFHLIEKETHELVERFDKYDSESLISYFAGGNEIDDDRAEFAQTIFDRMKEHGYRLTCCCKADEGEPPLLYASEPGILKRMPRPYNPEHAEHCPFGVARALGAVKIVPSRTQPDPDAPCAVHGPFSEPGIRNARSGSGRPGDSGPTIARLLFRILENSYVNWLFHGEFPDSRAQAWKVKRASEKVILAKNGDSEIRLRDMLITEPQYEKAIREINDLKSRIQHHSNWPTNSRPQGYQCAIVSDYKSPTGVGTYFSLDVHNWRTAKYIDVRPHVFGEGEDRTRDPYLAIWSYTLPDREAIKPLAMRCYMQPCYSYDSWFPVDSDYERQTLDTILTWRKELPEGLTVDIKKPLFDIKVDDESGLSCRPDFLLTVKKEGSFWKTVAVETMGITSVRYEQSKLRTHAIMKRKWGALPIQHDLRHRRAIDKEKATEEFLRALDARVLSNTR